jgi:hypothetical protein
MGIGLSSTLVEALQKKSIGERQTMPKQETVYAPKESFDLLSQDEQRTVVKLVRKGIVVLIDQRKTTV